MWEHPAPSQSTASSPLKNMADNAKRVAQICDLLEAMADDLPRRPAPVWREAALMCDEVVKKHYKSVLDVLLPVLETRIRGDEDYAAVLDRLHGDFEEEASRLSELSALMIDALEDSRGQIGAEALGYALRGFFGALRRNVSWEMDVLLPLAKRRLNVDDLSKIRQLMKIDPMTRPA